MKLLRPDAPKVLFVSLDLAVAEGVEVQLVGVSTRASSSFVNLTIGCF